MKINCFGTSLRAGFLVVVLAGACLQPWPARAAEEQTFDVLQIGATTYHNVTVTTKSKDYVFILHSTGMNNVKVAELPSEVRDKLGYADPTKPVVHTNGPTVWAKQTIAKLDDTAQVQEVKAEVARVLGPDPRAKVRELARYVNPVSLAAVGGALLLLHLFGSYCCALICRKASVKPGPLVWIPGLQIIPLFRAAEMSGWWFLTFFLPPLSIIPTVIWPFKIARVRGKTALTAICLLLPILNVFAFLYLAFSDREQPKRQERRVDIMTLEAA